MAKAQDFNAVVNEAIAALPIDAELIEKNVRAAADVNEKLASVALVAADASTDVATKAAKNTIAALAKAGKAKGEAADYANAMTAFGNFAFEQASKDLSTYAEIARNAQMASFDLLVAASKTASTEATKVAKKAVKAAK